MNPSGIGLNDGTREIVTFIVSLGRYYYNLPW